MRADYLKRAIPFLIKEGKPIKQAQAIAIGEWNRFRDKNKNIMRSPFRVVK